MARYWPKNGNLIGFYGLNSCGRVSDYDGICFVIHIEQQIEM